MHFVPGGYSSNLLPSSGAVKPTNSTIKVPTASGAIQQTATISLTVK